MHLSELGIRAMRKDWKIVEGSKITLVVEAKAIWKDGRYTTNLWGYDSPVTLPSDSPQIVNVEPPKKTPRR